MLHNNVHIHITDSETSQKAHNSLSLGSHLLMRFQNTILSHIKKNKKEFITSVKNNVESEYCYLNISKIFHPLK